MSASPATARRAAVVIPVHNRRATTLGCLRQLHATGVFAWAQVVVVDDGSTDGTAAAVAAEFPAAELLPGNGRWWWAGATAAGMRHALARPEIDAVIWLNDDCRPAPDALVRLVQTAAAERCVAVAQVEETDGGIRHGGLRKTWRGLGLAVCPADAVRSVDTMNGNCVCVPRAVAMAVGAPDAARFPQSRADSDYGFRCRRAGFTIRVVGPARCAADDPADALARSWLHGTRSLAAIVRSLGTPRSDVYPPSWWRFNLRYWGAWGIVLFAEPYLRLAAVAVIRLVLPARLRRRWFPLRAAQRTTSR